jgi:hypothetical protein
LRLVDRGVAGIWPGHAITETVMDACFGTEIRKENRRAPAFQKPRAARIDCHLERVRPDPAFARDPIGNRILCSLSRTEFQSQDSVLENDGRDHFSVKLNVTRIRRAANAVRRHDDAVNSCARPGPSRLCGRTAIPRVGIWRRGKTLPGGCTNCKSARNRKDLSPNTSRSGEPSEIVSAK